MQKLDNLYVSELEFEDSGMRGPQGESGDAPSLHVAKIAPFLYKLDAMRLDDHAAEVYVRKHFPESSASCAAVRNGRLVGHNYDDKYDDSPEFVVRTISKAGRHASVGIASIPGVLTQEMVDIEPDSELVKSSLEVMPYFVVDGTNDAGVTVVLHRMPGEDTDDLSDDSGMCALFVIRYLLDYANSAEHAVELLDEKSFWFPANDSLKARFYLLIADEKETIFSDLNGRQKVVNSSNIALLTNFDVIDWDGTHETLETHANGLERYAILESGAEEAGTTESMLDLLSQVWYTGVYDDEKVDMWLSDYNGDWSELGFGDLTIDSPMEDYAQAVTYCVNLFKERQRDGRTLQTVHSVVYDMKRKTLSMFVQEENNVYRFCMDELSLINEETERAMEAERAETERAMEAEQAIRDDFNELYYTRDVIDETVEDILQAIQTLHTTITDETNEKLEEKAEKPSNDGEIGQILYRSEIGSSWGDLPPELPHVTADDNDKVMAVEDGQWVATDKFADFLRYINMTVSIVADDGGVPTSGLTVAIENADTHDVINQAEYKGQPLTFRVPRGFHYIIRQSGKWEGYHNPQPEYIEGAATNDVTAVFTYEAIKIPDTLRELQIIVENGGAASLASHTGLQFEDTYTENGVTYSIVWDLKDVLPVLDEDGNTHDGVILEWHHATPTAMPFDAAERNEVNLSVDPLAKDGLYYYGLNGTTIKLLEVAVGDPLPTTYEAIYANTVRSLDGLVIRRGYAKYDESAVRKWLNSDAGAGEWWYPSHIGDMAPDQAETLPGFMAGCSEQILQMAKPARIRSEWSGNPVDVYDLFFLPSVDNVNGFTNHNRDEGSPWKDWIDATGFAEGSDDPCEGRKIYLIDRPAAQEIGLRSANNAYQYIVWDIKNDGSIDGYTNASAARRYTPCCVIYK